MDTTQPDTPGLPAHLVQQLHQAAQQVPRNGQAPHQATSRGGQRGSAPRGMNRGQLNITRYSQAPRQANMPVVSIDPRSYQQTGYQQGNVRPQARQNPPTSINQMGYQQRTIAPQAGSEDDFPALGSTRSSKSSRSSSQVPSQAPVLTSVTHEQAHVFQQRARAGLYRGHNPFPHQNTQGQGQQQDFASQAQHHVQQLQADDFRRPPPQNQGVYNPMAASMANQRHAFRKGVMLQSEYMETVAEVALRNQMPVEEQQEKEAMRQKLEQIMHDVIRTYGRSQSIIDPAKVKLKCYGSLASGFAVAGSDMDLLVTFPRDGEPTGTLEEDIKRLFERALLDVGYGARLLTQTRVPIMRVCETPTPDILDGLRRYRAKWEQDEQDAADVLSDNFDSNRLPAVTQEQIDAVSDLFAELGDEPGETALPSSPGRELPHLEYTKDCGIQCDINFSNYVALHNTRLLRTYCLLDERVRRMGLIVKAWAKARKINTPYHGTLSSYGYILMLLHFLINVTSPPVIPNLQAMARDKDAWAHRTKIETVDGFDVRFASDFEEIAAATEGWPRNQETLGALLRGFFLYYSDHGGFHWTNNIISIRTIGGALSKRSKGWTEAKWTGAKNTIRNRYLLCIEDPFEIEHNVARTVCHSGIVAIRDEFRRARKIIERVEKVRGGWQWLEDNRELGQDFMAVVEDRGDLLRKDHDFHKLKRLRAEAEATEKALKEANALVDLEQGDVDNGSKQNGTSNQHYSQSGVPFEAHEPSRKLTQSVGHQQDRSPLPRGRVRLLKSDSDDEDDDQEEKSKHETNVMIKEVPEDKGLSTSVRTNSSGSEEQDDSEPYCFYGDQLCPRAIDSFGKPLPWDPNTQEGRWLCWRDRKVRGGTFTGILSPGLRMLNEQCPFDPARPAPMNRMYRGYLEEIRPPFPMSKPSDEEAVDLSVEQTTPADEPSVVFPDCTNERLRWDLSVSDCRWLSKRDERIRAGTFIPPSDPLVRSLHLAFPYLVDTPGDEQLRRNNILRQRNTQWLKGQISQHLADNFPAYLEYLSQESSQDPHCGMNCWDMSLSDGRWLCKRDGMVRDGLFNRTRCPPVALQLHDDFPYSAHTSAAVQHKRNLQLRLREIERQMAQIPEELRQAWEDEAHQISNKVQKPSVEASVPKPEQPAAQEAPAEEESPNIVGAAEIRADSERPRWEVRNRLGKWLNDRDQAMLAGTWTRGNLWPWQRKLDKMFPFVAGLSEGDRTKQNEALRKLDAHADPTTAPSGPIDHTSKRCSHQKIGNPGLQDDFEAQLLSFSDDGQDSVSETTDQPWMKVGWESSTLNGRWLRWRDKQIKQGTWKEFGGGRFRRLDAMFPYIENPSLEEQTSRNARLLAMYKDQKSTRPERSTLESQQATDEKSTRSRQISTVIVGSSKNACSAVQESSGSDQKARLPKMIWDNTLLGSWFSWRDNKIRSGTWKEVERKRFLCWLDESLPYIPQPTLDQQIQMNEQLKSITAEYPRLKEFEGLQHVRRGRPSAKDMIYLLSLEERKSTPQRRLAQNTESKAPSNDSRRSSEQDFVRSQRLNYFTSQSTRTKDDRPENQNPNNPQALMAEAELFAAPSTNITNTATAVMASLSVTASLTNNSEKPCSNVPSTALVPQSLHHGPADTRPRDEDPNIMPIPSALYFAFDERQLRDLNIIQQGGNGCARFGEEWNIETEDEWGGGGWMGYKSSEKQDLEDARQAAEEKWEGKGDEEGLLGELPCL